MEITLESQIEAYVKDQVKRGVYHDPSALVNDALRLFSERDAQPRDFTPDHEVYLREKLAQGEQDIAQGRGVRVDGAGLEQLAKDIKREGRERLSRDSKSEPE